MTCDELRQDYTAYALGIAGEPERSEIAEHLERQCPNCLPGVKSAMATVTAMSGAVKIAEPPKSLRNRVMALTGRAPRRSSLSVYLPWAITALVSVVLIAVGISGRRQMGQTAALDRALSILNDPATRDVSFGQEKPAKGRVFVSADKGIVFLGANLPRIGAGKAFELWVIPAKGMPAPVGVFESQSDSTAVYVRPGPVENAAAIAVTVEPEGGSPQPTTTPFIVARL